MKSVFLAASLVLVPTAQATTPPPGLGAAMAQWAGENSVSRFQFSLSDLNGDGTLDAIVHVTDPNLCRNFGCPLVVFKGTLNGYELVANSGFVRKPIYVLEEAQLGWHTLTAYVGFGNSERLVPVRFIGPMYNQAPYLRMQVKLTPEMTKEELNFLESP